ncbi:MULTISPECIES: efflux RND transporter periplasmic adaptor subunit [unclassified Acinetobacter]|uniref:efflux RND transporter periplasmic adaptor subunit n=1 Tax=unclassified Acinetobacter TaxID=196816 RepID=UPI002934BDF4|nr:MULTISPECIES: efflux RND transporter periplasmic adaptor subunit [unclassified Acinetobacter]WOE32387.1 efflux RND transporter periplasmic adaptor subunit [Acinetobacter sp. SAAs470]WOE37860.1 efflux RND transporter periplasmic adaptor subunit [Acinetobacter sp. SAAs474]
MVIIFGYYDQKKQANKIPPSTSLVQRHDITESVKAIGEVYATELVSVGAQVSGQILKLHVQLGQAVKKGDLLVEIDAKTQYDKLNMSKAELESAQADLVAKNMLLLTAEKSFIRKKTLYQVQAESKELLEQAENHLKQQEMAVQMAKLRIKQLQINVNTAKTELAYTQIKSPLTGTIVSLPIKEGQTINFAQTTPLIAVIANLQQMEVRMQIAEGDYTKLKPNMPVIFSTLANPDIKLNGKIISIDPALTALSKGIYDHKTENADVAVYYYARMIVKNPHHILSIGMTTQNEIILQQKKNILTIPKSAIFATSADQALVAMYGENHKISLRKIKTGISNLNQIEVLDGLKAGESVLTDFQQEENLESKGSTL